MIPNNRSIGGLQTPPHSTPVANMTVANDRLNLTIWGDEIAATLPKYLAFATFATIDNTLVGTAGSQIGFVTNHYTGPAVDVNEGEKLDFGKLELTTKYFEVKKVSDGKAYTDEAQLHDPSVQRATAEQFQMAIADKMDNDCGEVLRTAPSGGSLEFTVDGFANLIVAFGETNATTHLLVSPLNYSRLWAMVARKELEGEFFTAGNERLMSIGGIIIHKRAKVTDTEAFMIRDGGLFITMANTLTIKEDHDIDTDVYKIRANASYVAYLKDDSRVLQLTVGN